MNALKIYMSAPQGVSPEQLAAFLDEQCGDDAELREQVNQLITAEGQAGHEFLDDGPLAGSVVPSGSVGRRFVPGEVIAGRYRIVSLLGSGGMGEVYRADDLTLEQPVALKFLPAALAADNSLRRALHNEVRQARRVSHRHVCRVYDIGEAEGLPFLSMEFIEGENLASLLRRIGRLPEDKAVELAQQLCAGVQAAHEEGLVHLDLKPANLMIDDRGALRVADFGLAQLTCEAASGTRRAGTPAYMAPEQWLHGEASKRSDLYAVGLILYEMFTGRQLHDGRSADDIIAWHRAPESADELARLFAPLTPGTGPLILQCLEREPARRPESVEAVLTGLNALAAAPAGQRESPSSSATRSGSPPRSGKQLVALMFTDLVGSVAMQQRLGTEAYMRYVARHDDIFKDCFDLVPDAQILNETGDGFLVRFDDPSDAVNTALRLQYRFRQEKAEGESIQVRIGLNLGVVTEMEEKNRGVRRAVGMPINLTARIMDLGDCGQILMARSVYDEAQQFVREHPSMNGQKIDEPLAWKAHGLYQFKGSLEPLEIFQVGAVRFAPLVAPQGSDKSRRVEQIPADPAVTAEIEILPPEELRGSDVFIAYSPLDDEPVTAGTQGWVSKFHQTLEYRLERLPGAQVRVWREPDPTDPNRAANILPFLSEVKSMVSVVSPPFVRSSECLRDVEVFVDQAVGAGTLLPGGHSRLLKVVKSPVDQAEIPPQIARAFSQLAGFEFFESDPETGRVREFDEVFGKIAEQHFHEKVYDLAREIREVLKACAPDSLPASLSDPASLGPGKTIYLAECTSGVQNERDQIRRELLELGHRVVPSRPLPMTGPELEQAVRDYLATADLAVHLVGEHYGMIPEDADQSVIEIQIRLAAEHPHDTGFGRLIWIPRDVQPRDERQAAFLRALREDPRAQRGVEVIQDTIENLKLILLDELAPKQAAEAPPPAATAAPDGAPTVYLISDQRDEEAIEPLEDFLFDQGFDVHTPHFEGSEAEVANMHRSKLNTCDAVLVYYGAGSKAWVETKLMDVVQSPGYGRSKPMRAQMVFVAPPDDRRKARFRTHSAEVIRQESDEWDPAMLAPLVAQMRQGGRNHG